MNRVFKQAFASWFEQRMSHHGAALAFHRLFARVPIVFATVFAAGRVLGEVFVRQEAVKVVRELIGPAAAHTFAQARESRA